LRKEAVAPKVGVTRFMHEDLSQPTKDEVLFQLRRRYVSAGREHQRKLIT